VYPPTHFEYRVTAKVQEAKEKQNQRIEEKSCYVVGTNIHADALSSQQVIQAYKNQNKSIERGVRFLAGRRR